MGRAQGAQEGQHGLRPARPLHRIGGHARRHHGRDAQALSRTRRAGDGVRLAAKPRRAASLLPACGTTRGRGADRLRVHGRSHRLVRRPAHPGRAPAAFRRRAVVRSARAIRCGGQHVGADGAAARRRERGRAGDGCRRRAVAYAGRGAVEGSGIRVGSAEGRGRLDQARHLGADRARGGIPGEGRRRRSARVPRRAPGPVRTFRRRQRALQRLAAARHGARRLPRALGCDGACRARRRGLARRLDLGRARDRPSQGGGTGAREKPGRDRTDAARQSRARSQGHPESGKAARAVDGARPQRKGITTKHGRERSSPGSMPPDLRKRSATSFWPHA